MLYVVLFYIVILLMGDHMLTATVEDKENRVTAMILTTNRAKTLLVGKVISLFIIGFVRMLVFAIPIAAGYVFLRDKINIPDVDFAHLALEPRPMIVGTLVVLASFSLFIAILAVSLIITSADPRIVQVFTLFPYTAPVTALLRNAFGSLPLWMAIVDIVVMFVLAAIVLQVAVRIFKYGSIEYGKKVSLRGAFAARSNP